MAVENIRKSQNKWMRVPHILGQKGADAKISGIFLKAVVHSVLLFRVDKWVVTP